MALVSISVLEVTKSPKWLPQVSMSPKWVIHVPCLSGRLSMLASESIPLKLLLLTWVLEQAKCCVYPLKVTICYSSLAPTKVIPIGLQSQKFWGLSFWYRTPWLRSSVWGLNTSLWYILYNYFFCHFWVTHQGMWILTLLCLHPSMHLILVSSLYF